VELELAARLKRSGVDVSLIPASSAGASPDFRAVLHRRSIAFECAAMNDKLAAQQANHVIDRLFDFPTRHPGFRAAIAVHFTDNVLATEAFKRFDEIEACVLDAGAAGKNKHLDGLCRCEHIPGDGPPVVRPINGLGLGSWPDGEVQHLLRLVRKKIAHGQLAAEAGGVLVIRVQTLLTGYGQDPADLVDYVGALLAAAVADAPHVCAVLAYEKWLSSPIEPCEFEGDWGVGIRDADEAGVSRVAVLAGNPRAAAPLTPDEVAVLVGLTTRR
jgi:Holliday junction resolvase